MIRQRQLNLNDLGEAWRMPPEDAERQAAPPISELRELAMPAPVLRIQGRCA